MQLPKTQKTMAQTYWDPLHIAAFLAYHLVYLDPKNKNENAFF